MPDNTSQSWGECLIGLADEAKRDAVQHDTSLALHSMLSDLDVVLRAWAGRMGVHMMPAPQEPLADSSPAAVEPENIDALFERYSDPRSWESIEQARAGLRIAIRREHAKRTATRQSHLERVLALSDPDYERAPQETIELKQHRESAMRLGMLDARLGEMLDWVDGNDDLEAAKTYDVMAGWE